MTEIAVSVGEPSGDLIAGLIEESMKTVAPDVRLVRLGGDPAAIFGFKEGLLAAPRMARQLDLTMDRIVRRRPRAVILVGYSGFNLPMGRRCRRLGLPVVYVAPPQVWAWGAWRVRALRQSADRVVCLLPFEADCLSRAGVAAVYYGYPLLDTVRAHTERREQTCVRLGLSPADRYVVFLPGSRPAEIKHHWPLFCETFRRLRRSWPDLRGVMVAAADGPLPYGMQRVEEGRYGVMQHADGALCVSGTATAELTILGTPMVVCYHLATASRFVARALVRTKWFALPNIVARDSIVPEYLEPGAEVLAGRVADLLAGDRERAGMIESLRVTADQLGPGGATAGICRLVLSLARPG